jgi:hypothetical protein
MDDAGGLYAAALVEQHVATYPGVEVRDVPDTNHYTIVMSDAGARAVADALDDVSR